MAVNLETISTSLPSPNVFEEGLVPANASNRSTRLAIDPSSGWGTATVLCPCRNVAAINSAPPAAAANITIFGLLWASGFEDAEVVVDVDVAVDVEEEVVLEEELFEAFTLG
jgi:hypothetical protein